MGYKILTYILCAEHRFSKVNTRMKSAHVFFFCKNQIKNVCDFNVNGFFDIIREGVLNILKFYLFYYLIKSMFLGVSVYYCRKKNVNWYQILFLNIAILLSRTDSNTSFFLTLNV